MRHKLNIIYIRVSSDSQTSASQMADLKAWDAIHGPCEWFEETASGTTMVRKRQAWQLIEKLIDEGRVDTLVVWRLDRLGRTASGLTKLFDKLVKKDINLVSLREGIDLSTPAGRLTANVMASVAMYETEVRKERQASGIAAARAQGKRWGGSRPGRITKRVRAKLPHIIDLYLKGTPMKAIERAYGIHRNTIARALKVKYYIDNDNEQLPMEVRQLSMAERKKWINNKTKEKANGQQHEAAAAEIL